MAALISEIAYNVSPHLGGKLIKFEAPTTANGDWCIFPDPIGAIKANEVDGTDAITTYATALVGDVNWTDSAVTLDYDGATAAKVPEAGYIMVGTEIIRYAGGGAAVDDEFTGCARGCFGTTAAVHTDGDTIYFLNTIQFALDTAGPIRGIAEIIEE